MSLQFGVHFTGCGVATFSALFAYLSSFCQRAAGDVLRRILRPSLETGAVFDAVLSVNHCTIAIRVSVRAVQEKCDESSTSRFAASCYVDALPRRQVHGENSLTRILP